MASLIGFLRGAKAQINPFDNGATYNTVLQNRAPAQPTVAQNTAANRSFLDKAFHYGAPSLGNAVHKVIVQPVARATLEGATSLAGTQQTFHPGNRVEKFLLGNNPVQNIERKVATQYNRQSKSSNPLLRAAAGPLAAAEGLFSVATDIPVGFGAAKVALKGSRVADTIIQAKTPIRPSSLAERNKWVTTAANAPKGSGPQTFAIRRIGEIDKRVANEKRIDAAKNINKKGGAGRLGLSTQDISGGAVGKNVGEAKGQGIRSFPQTVKQSPITKPQLAEKVGGTYTVKSNKTLLAQARGIIGKDYDTAHTIGTTEASDRGVAVATELIKHHQARGEFNIAADIANKAAVNLTELGRGVQAASLYSKISPEGIVRFAAKQAQKSGKELEPSIAKQLTQMAEEVGKMPDGEGKAIAVQKMLDLAKAQNPSSLANKIVTIWKAGLLTAPTTHAGNIASNILETVTKQGLVNPLAKAFDVPTSLVTGQRSRSLSIKGFGAGTKEGISRGGKYAKTGYDVRNPLGKYELQNKVVFGKGKLGRAAEAYTQGVFRTLGAADQPFYYATLRQSLRDRALTAAKNEGIGRSQRQAYVNEFIKNPSQSALQGATEDAKRVVFANQTTLSKAASGFKRSTGAGGQFVIPFSQVPASIATRILERSPIEYVRAANQIRKAMQGKGFDQRAFTENLANATIGTVGAVVIGKELVNHGLITLGYPTTQKEQAQWKAEGRQPYSVKLGNKWLSLNYVQPFGSVLAYGAAYEQAKKDGQSSAQALSTAIGAASKSITSQSFLKGVSSAIDTLNDPARSASLFLENTAASTVPNFIRSIARSTDPLQRQVNGPVQAVQGGIPGQRQKLLPAQDVYGTDLPRPSSTTNSLLNPLRPSNIRQTPVTSEVRRLSNTDPSNTDMNVTPTPLKKTQTFNGQQITLNDQQLYGLQKSVGQNTDAAWSALIKTPEYKALSDPDKVAALKNLKADVVALAKNQYAQQNSLPESKLTKRQQGILDGSIGLADYTSKKTTSTKTPKTKSTKAKTTGSGSRKLSTTGFKTASFAKSPSLPKIKVAKAKKFTAPTQRKLAISKLPVRYRGKAVA